MAIINSLVNGVLLRKELGVGKIFNGKSIRKINAGSIVLSDDSIHKVEYDLSDEAIREMISTTIEVHLQKEQKLFEQGIKALTLFFIPSDIALYNGENAKIKKIFEEEYAKQRAVLMEKIDKGSAYYKYLQNDGWTASLFGTLQHYKEDVKMMF